MLVTCLLLTVGEFMHLEKLTAALKTYPMQWLIIEAFRNEYKRGGGDGSNCWGNVCG